MTRPVDALVLTCEHGGNEVPKAYVQLFRNAGKVLATHRGVDIGALAVARRMAQELGAPFHFSTVSRLLVDVNRSLHVKGAWSEWTRDLSAEAKAEIVARHYEPYREAVRGRLARLVEKGARVLHLSIHSFTPVLNGVKRNAEIGILYDPRRGFEAKLAQRLAATLREGNEGLTIRRNYPYLGYSDGFTTHLRRVLPATLYAGIEIETRQDEIETPAGQRRYAELYVDAIRSL